MSSWLWAALLPHPPLLIPEVGRGMEYQVSATITAFETVGEKLSKLKNRGKPDFIFVLSPHHFYKSGRLVLNKANNMLGDFAYFRAPEVQISLNNSPLFNELEYHLKQNDIPISIINEPQINCDHGSMVPLYFFKKLWGDLPQAILSCPIGLSYGQALALGKCLSDFSPQNGSWALLASGDLSHRLDITAPGGYSPDGKLFDHDVVEALKNGDWKNLLQNWPSERLAKIGECGFRSVLCFLSLCGKKSEFLSYEGPFGVGYACALGINDKA